MTTARNPHDQVRAEAAWVVERTLNSRAPADTFLQGALDRCDPRDAGLLRELVLGTLRWLRRLDDVIGHASERSLEKIEPALLAPMRVAAYQIFFLDRVPMHAVVNEAVEHARSLTHRGGASFVNAVLRRIARAPSLEQWPIEESRETRRLAIELSHPDFLVERWWARLGEASTRRLLEANNRPKPLHLMASRDRGGRELLAESLIDEGCEVEASALAPLGLKVRAGRPLDTRAFREGEFYVQDEASQAAALVPSPQPGERVLDLAAAPGGKSFALMAMEPTLDCVLSDLDPGRIGLVRANFKRLGRSGGLVVADARRSPFVGVFDRVVLDVPCSGTGTFRKHPELKWRLSEGEIDRLSRQSLRLARASCDLVRPGGLLTVISCSLEEEENEDVVTSLLAERSDFGRCELDGCVIHSLAAHVVGPGFLRIWTADDHDGFSVSVLRRKGEP